MLDNKGFDLWADDYDKSVSLSEENDEYPFAGYKNVLNMIYNEIRGAKTEKGDLSKLPKVLDIGFGTGVLTEKLYNDGYDITGVDFSHKMIETAALKMPKARLIEYDFSKELPDTLLHEKFDYIISTYALHHLTDKFKADFLNELHMNLNQNGKIIIGDVSFTTRELLKKCREKYKDLWDDDEFYFVYEEIKGKLNFPVSRYISISHCAGVLLLANQTI